MWIWILKWSQSNVFQKYPKKCIYVPRLKKPQNAPGSTDADIVLG